MAKSRVKIDHSNCECVVFPKAYHMGLYCLPHKKYIKWLSKQEQQQIRKMDIVWLADTPAWALTKKDINKEKSHG